MSDHDVHGGLIYGLGPPHAGPTFRDPRSVRELTVYRDTTPVVGGFWLCMVVAGANTWLPLGAPAVPPGWSKYVVSSQPTPSAPYATIQAAIAAAVADLHTAALPAVVLVHPGTYAPPGQVLVVPPGVSLCALSQPGGATAAGAAVVVQAGVDLSGSTSAHILSGIAFETTNGTPALRLGGTAALRLTASGCAFTATGAPAVLLSNHATTSTAAFRQCHLRTRDGVAEVVHCGMVASAVAGATFFGCVVDPLTDSSPAVVLDAGSQATFTASVLLGMNTLGAGATLALIDTNAGSQTSPIFDLGLDAQVRIEDGNVASPSPLTRGSGYLTTNNFGTSDPEFGTPGQRKAPETQSYVIARVAQRYTAAAAGAGPIAYPESVAVLTVDPAGAPGPVVVNLRALATYFHGESIVVKAVGAPVAILVQPAGTDEIDGLGPGVAYALPATGYAAVELLASNLAWGCVPARPIKWLTMP